MCWFFKKEWIKIILSKPNMGSDGSSKIKYSILHLYQKERKHFKDCNQNWCIPQGFWWKIIMKVWIKFKKNKILTVNSFVRKICGIWTNLFCKLFALLCAELNFHISLHQTALYYKSFKHFTRNLLIGCGLFLVKIINCRRDLKKNYNKLHSTYLRVDFQRYL